MDDLVLILTRRFPSLPIQQEEVNDLLGVVAERERSPDHEKAHNGVG